MENLWQQLMLAQARQMPPQQQPQTYQGLFAPQQQNPYAVPVPWPMPPGMQPPQVVPPQSRDVMDRSAVMNGYDRNAIQGQDLMQRYFYPNPSQENI